MTRGSIETAAGFLEVKANELAHVAMVNRQDGPASKLYSAILDKAVALLRTEIAQLRVEALKEGTE